MNIPVENCSSCGACANVCAQGAITMQLDKEGFFRPIVEASKCIHCGACEKKCPWTTNVDNPHDSRKNPLTLAAYAKDESIRIHSSSGGVFTILANEILDRRGVVVGVAQLSPTHFGHIVVENKADLAKLQGSKYVQADVGSIYKIVFGLLKKNRQVLFSGTPCQVAALYATLGKFASSKNLFTIDIVCHGVPSVKVFEKYIRELECQKNNLFDSVVFREKNTGWKKYSLLYRFKDGKRFLENHNQSKYMRLFLSRICQNISCCNCHYRKLPRIADITLGDYWGVAKYHPEMDDDKGTSVVILNNKHGCIFFNSIEEKMILKKTSIDYVVSENPCLIRSGKQHPQRAVFFERLNLETIDELVAHFLQSKNRICVLLGAIKYKLKLFLLKIKFI